MGTTVNTYIHIRRQRAAFPNRAAWRAHQAQQRKVARSQPRKVVEMRIWGSDLRAGDQIAISTTPGMETYEAPVASTDAGSSTCVSYQRTDGSRGNVAADERIWVRRVGG